MMPNINSFLVKYPNLEELTTSGGFKDVYKGTHSDYGDIVVKKGKISTHDIRERTKREVEALKAIDSKYYPKQYDFYIDEDNFVIVEEFIAGGTLASQIGNYKGDESKIIIFFDKLIDALDLIWAKNIVHRDLKPANIMIRPDGTPCVIDLGVARFIDDPALTKTAVGVPGTINYAAPEQLNNQRLRVDIRTDFFILGIVLLEMYLGRHPFNTTKYQDDLIYNIRNGKYIQPEQASEHFRKLIKKLLEVQPYNRWNNYTQIKNMLIQNWTL